ncbi:hypothetical protein [Paraburkholderia unamae]|uniref:Uncharacterized protein n=1 Tax=Paraburkholderia unamae TaxID=219649 RepID=A0ACC6RM17_9BURK
MLDTILVFRLNDVCVPAAGCQQSVVAGRGVKRCHRHIGHDHVDLLRKRFIKPLPGVCKAISLCVLRSRRRSLSRRLRRETEHGDGFVPFYAGRNCHFDESFDRFACFHP